MASTEPGDEDEDPTVLSLATESEVPRLNLRTLAISHVPPATSMTNFTFKTALAELSKEWVIRKRIWFESGKVLAARLRLDESLLRKACADQGNFSTSSSEPFMVTCTSHPFNEGKNILEFASTSDSLLTHRLHPSLVVLHRHHDYDLRHQGK